MMFKLLALVNGRTLPPDQQQKYHTVDDEKIAAAQALVQQLRKGPRAATVR